ncbi:class I SAM-dependent DNA methyltransferase [Roseovarius phycicola]|uniref:Methyltransferase domain-containing protein n=1 Tax=Roseovarius phycicola TaxID=3080976 RepID=A0ABZ2HHL5_9RHOB
MAKQFLDEAYHLDSAEDTQALYNDWAASYDAETGENGYATPGRLAEALAEHVEDLTAPILDFGCGTGLSGLALKLAGFKTIDGMDPNAEMLAQAEPKGVYRTLTEIDVTDPNPISQGNYATIAAIGVIGTGAAPPETFDLLMNALDRGGIMSFSFNDHAMADASYTTRLDEWVDGGKARLVYSAYGPHLPKRDINSTIYILEKT